MVWIARDRDNTLYVYCSSKPIRNSKEGIWESKDGDFNELLPNNIIEDEFPEINNITWDDEPIELK